MDSLSHPLVAYSCWEVMSRLGSCQSQKLTSVRNSSGCVTASTSISAAPIVEDGDEQGTRPAASYDASFYRVGSFSRRAAGLLVKQSRSLTPCRLNVLNSQLASRSPGRYTAAVWHSNALGREDFPSNSPAPGAPRMIITGFDKLRMMIRVDVRLLQNITRILPPISHGPSDLLGTSMSCGGSSRSRANVGWREVLHLMRRGPAVWC